jgi:hypothetical protein
MRGQHAHIGLQPEALERVGGGLHLVGVVGRTHEDANLANGHWLEASSAMSDRKWTPGQLMRWAVA